LVILSMAYGYWAHRSGAFPHGWVLQAEEGWRTLKRESGTEAPWYLVATSRTERMHVYQPASVQPGLTLIAGIDGDDKQFAEIIDERGDSVHRWSLDWFALWPDADHLESDVRPRSPP